MSVPISTIANPLRSIFKVYDFEKSIKIVSLLSG